MQKIIVGLLFCGLTACFGFRASAQISSDEEFQGFQRQGKDIDWLDVGLYTGFQIGDVSIVEFSPMVGFRLHDRFHVGTGILYNYAAISRSNYLQHNFGNRTFVRGFVYNDFFLQADAQFVISQPRFRRVGKAGSSYTSGNVFTGGGYRFVISDKVYSNLEIMFNMFVDDEFYPNRQPSFRLSFWYHFGE